MRMGDVIILLLAFVFRVVNLVHLPVFYDEACYIRWAQQTHDRLDLSIGLKAVSTLQIWILALFLDFSPSPLWIGRFVSVAAGVLTVAISYAIALQLYRSRRAAQLSALLYAVLPYALFHDRLAQNDGLLSFFLALVVYLSIRIFSLKNTKQRLILAVWLVLVFGLALLTKRSGILFIGTPFLTGLILHTWTNLRHFWRWVIGVSMGLLLITLPITWIAASTSDQLAAQMTSLDWGSLTSLLPANVTELWDWFSSYFLLPALLFLASSVVYSLMVHRRRQDFFLLVVAFIPIVFFTILSTRWYPRYLMPAIFPLAILMAGQITLLSAPRGRENKLLIAFLTTIIVLPMLWFNLKLISDPIHTPLPQADRRQYIEGMPAGYGLPEAAAYLSQIAAQGQSIYVWRNSRNAPTRHGFPLYLPERSNIKLKRFSTLDKSWAEVERDFDSSAQRHLTYVLLNLPREKGVPKLEEIPQLMLEQKFFKPGNKGFIGVYRWLSPLEYLLVSGNLMPRSMIFLPADTDITLMPAAREKFNLVNSDETISLSQLLTDKIFDYIVLNDHLLQEYGLLQKDGELLQLPEDLSLEASEQGCQWCIFKVWNPNDVVSEAMFGEEINILGAQIPTQPWTPDEPLPITIYWQSSLDVLDNDLAVFLHGVNQQGQLVTQQDATWLNGRFPASIHQENDLLSQRFNLDLSGIEGEICLYTGLYHRSSGERVAARQGNKLLPNNAFPLGCGSVSYVEK